MAIINTVTVLSSSQIVWGVIFLSFCYVAAVVVYRLYFHPLAKYPGPFWARISAVPAYYYTLRQDRHVWFWQLQEKYDHFQQQGKCQKGRVLQDIPTQCPCHDNMEHYRQDHACSKEAGYEPCLF
ncbi:hypothetical protein LB505_002537 [Fusarium chuoi]|nr:hypothetical protein LB505_002537 [Fusarium chuoi]